MLPFRVGLVLGGGGARGLSHIGIINVLEREKIPVHIVGGTSVGALIGGIYAQQKDAAVLEKKVRNFIKGPRFKELGVNNFKQKREKDPDDVLRQLTHRVKRHLIINLAANRLALLKAKRLRVAITALLKDGLIEDCKLPFACVATDLKSGDAITFRNGRIRPAVEGSSAIPGFIPPVKHENYELIDGSVTNNFPIEIVREMGATLVVTVDASLNFENNVKIDNVIDLVIRSAQITTRHLDYHLKKESDIVITPEIGDVHWSEFNRVDELIKIGEVAANNALPEIKKLIKRKKRLFTRFFSNQDDR